MCGITGILNLDGAPVQPRVLRSMTDLLRHRGPDDQGFRLFSLRSGTSSAWSPDGPREPAGAFEGGLGFNRLSILDLSEHGAQPMVSADGSTLLIYNGETYNAFEHRPALEAAGYRFRSRTDTETLLYLYQEYGIDGMVERLNGMFAFCVVDLRRRRLYLVRDRLGIKPLYWWTNQRVLLFSSETKAFLEHPDFQPELAAERLDEHFLFRYEAMNGSLLRGVRQLEPGAWLCLHDGSVETHTYWTVSDYHGGPSVDRREAADRLDAHVRRSVRTQLLSDVKVGCQLSGGIDSSLVTLLAARQSPGSMDGFSVIFNESRVSEEVWIDEAARVAGVDHHKFILDGDVFSDAMEKATWHLDQPVNHPNSLGIFHLARQACPIITVFLSGEGADELFGGYTRFLYARLRSTVAPFTPILRWLPRVGGRLAARFDEGPRDPIGWFIWQSAFLAPSDLLALRPDADVPAALASRREIFERSSGEHLGRCIKYELRTHLHGLLLRQDKMTMAHSMENRVPFLDHELVECVRSLPPDRLVSTRPSGRLRASNTKVVLKDVASRYFRPGFVYRPKMGFPLPLHEFLRAPKFRSMMTDMLLPGIRQRGIVDGRVVTRWWDRLQQGDDTHVEGLWICGAFELWAQSFLDGRRPPQRQS